MKGNVIQACFLGLIQNLDAQRDGVTDNGWHFVMPCYDTTTGEIAQPATLTKVKTKDRYILEQLLPILQNTPLDLESLPSAINSIGGGIQGGANGVVPVFLRAQFSLLSFLGNVVNELHNHNFNLPALKKFRVNLGGFEQDFNESVQNYLDANNEELATFLQFSSHVNKLKSELDALQTQIANANDVDVRSELEIAALRIMSIYFNGALVQKSDILSLHEIQEAFTAEEKRINDLLKPLLDAQAAHKKEKAKLDQDIANLEKEIPTITDQLAQINKSKALKYIKEKKLPEIERQLAECQKSISPLQKELADLQTKTAEQVNALMSPPSSPKTPQHKPNKSASTSSSSSSSTTDAAAKPATTQPALPTKKNNDQPKPNINFSLICGAAIFTATCAIGLMFVAKKLSLNSIKLSDVFSKVATLGRSS